LQNEVESQLQSKCLHDEEGCEIRVGGETFLALPLRRADWEGHYQILSFQSLDAAMKEFTQGFVGLFLWIGALGTMGAMLLALVGARTISQPITDLILCLKESQESGRLRTDFPADSAVEEVNLLATALNQAAQAAQDSQERLEEASLEFLETMARALDARDPYTAGHSDRVSANSTAIAEAMGLPPDQAEIIRIGAKMHDIGKIGIPDAVLQKPGALTEEEFDLIKLHPQMGKRILEKAGQFQDYLPIIELHHEDWDGRGYPYGLVGEEVPLGARIVHVADVYDAITSNRAYRSAMPREQVQEIMQRGSGTQFDPEVAEVFLSLLRQRQMLEDILGEVNATPCYDDLPSQFS
jgi:response regulator RpfG family c-di-GMP phosphodiesterase